MGNKVHRALGIIAGLLIACGSSTEEQKKPDGGSIANIPDAVAPRDVGRDGAAADTGGLDAAACSPTLHGQSCATNGAFCSYTGHQCRCEVDTWVCSLCPDAAPTTGASCADITSSCTYDKGRVCVCSGIPLPTWACANGS